MAFQSSNEHYGASTESFWATPHPSLTSYTKNLTESFWTTPHLSLTSHTKNTYTMVESEQHELLKKVATCLDDFGRDLNQVKKDLKQVKRDLKQVKTLFERESGTYGRASSTMFTIVLSIERDGSVSTLGHGILIKAGEQFFVQTAAHVALSFRQFQEQSFRLEISFLSNRRVLACNSDDLKFFFRAEYITEGTDDIAFISTSFNSEDSEDIDSFEAVSLGIEQCDAFATDFYGRTFDVRFKSHAFLNSQGRRVGLAAPSKPGCSGAPLFSDDGKLLALLHGATKHRCKMKHSPSNHGHHGARTSDDMDDMSTFVYVDMVQGVTGVKFWDGKYILCLMHLEDLNYAEIEIRRRG